MDYSERSLLNALHAIRNKYGRDEEERKRGLIAALIAHPLRPIRMLHAFHNDLLFICAFPGEERTRKAARRALTKVGVLIEKTPRSERNKLDDTGLAGTKSRHVFAYPIVQWLARRAPGEADIDWSDYQDPTQLDLALRSILRISELDGFDSGHFSTREWLKLARRHDRDTDLQWISETLDAQKDIDGGPLWDAAEPPVVWDLTGSRWSVTHNALSEKPVFRTQMRRPAQPATKHIATPLKNVRTLEPHEARKVINAAHAALTARCREVVSTSYANSKEVHWCNLGEGTALAVIGAEPAHMMSIEANYGYVIFSNGVPIGYGGVTALFRQANTGINIFDPFRGGEAAFLWTQMLRAFQTLFGVRRFVVNAYQFGQGNAEALDSGAYWFYYRLGFRPVDATLRKLASREARRLAGPGAAKSTKVTLKALAVGDIVLDLPGFDRKDYFDETLLPCFGARSAIALAGEPVSSRSAAEKRVAEKFAKRLGVRSMKKWPLSERRAFALLAPGFSIVSGVEDFSPEERRAIVSMMRAKGHAQESDYARAATKCPRFFRALMKELKRPL